MNSLEKEKREQEIYESFFAEPENLKSIPLSCPKKSDNWKPSEEQMEALLSAEGLLRKYHKAIASKLAELYEDLKKL